MKYQIILFLTCSGIVQISCDTIHFTNSQTHLEKSIKTFRNNGTPKTYQLDVPGSRPITIIEAESDYDRREPKQSGDNERKTKDYVVPGSTVETETGRCLGPSCLEFAQAKNTVYSPDLLNKFLLEYADKIKNADQKTKDILQQMEITTQSSASDKSYHKKKITEKIDIQLQAEDTKKSSWDQSNSKRNKHPFNDRDGWVTLEAVPWSKSKITKWQANTQKINKPNVYAAFDNSNDRFTYGSSDVETDYDTHPFAIEKPNDTFDYKPSYASDNNWPQEAPSRPSWNRPNKPQSYHSDWNQEQRPHRPDCDHNNHNNHDNGFVDGNRRVSNYYYENDGIITDGKPGDFPVAAASTSSGPGHRFKDGNYKRPTQVLYADLVGSNHPATHPSTGDGEWVLLSTTKGYQFPKSRQRSLSIAPTSISSRRSVKLTVLPALNSTKENMTTSHGGMLEVEPSFHTVEESRRMGLAANASGNRIKHVKLKNVMTTNSAPDSSAVIAAVGAGLVPATVAMIMPMVLGRKKRSAYNRYLFYLTSNQNVTQHPHLDYESTIQRTLK